MQQYLEVGYAPSNRVRCSTCYQTINKNEIKFGHVFVAPGYGYDKKYWYHLNCLKFMPKADRNEDVPLQNIRSLKQEDQKKVRDKIESIQKNGKKIMKENKILHKQEEKQDYIRADKDIFSTYVTHMRQKYRKDLSEF